MKRDQTWAVLAQVLGTLRYTRDQPPHFTRDSLDDDGMAVLFDNDRFRLLADAASNYAVLYVYTYNPNTYDPARMRLTRHEFVVPVATYHQEGWKRWVFDRIASVEHHETCESFQEVDLDTGEWHRPYAPHHGNGWDPYTFWPGHDIAEKAKAPGDD